MHIELSGFLDDDKEDFKKLFWKAAYDDRISGNIEDILVSFVPDVERHSFESNWNDNWRVVRIFSDNVADFRMADKIFRIMNECNDSNLTFDIERVKLYSFSQYPLK